MTRTFIIATILTLGTALSAAAGCRAHSGPVMTCVDGTIWDSSANACVPITSS